MKPTIINLIIVFIIVMIIRFLVLEYSPKIIINGYISIFFCFYILTYIFTKNPFYSIIIGLIITNARIIYRTFKDKESIEQYNSSSNIIMFVVALIFLILCLRGFKDINKMIDKYYGLIIFILIMINFSLLKVNNIDNQLLCFL